MKPEIFWQFRKCVEGMSDACRKFDTPVSGGNVSFYNESPDGAIDPTPVIGMVGLIEGRDPVPSAFQAEGDVVVLVGTTREELGGSEFLKVLHARKEGMPPRLDLDEADRFNRFILACAAGDLLRSAHDLSEGGLAVALAECCICDERKTMGAEISVPQEGLSLEALFFGESQSRAVITVRTKDWESVSELAQESGLPCRRIGQTGGQKLRINGIIEAPIPVLSETWRGAIGRRIHSEV